MDAEGMSSRARRAQIKQHDQGTGGDYPPDGRGPTHAVRSRGQVVPAVYLEFPLAHDSPHFRLSWVEVWYVQHHRKYPCKIFPPTTKSIGYQNRDGSRWMHGTLYSTTHSGHGRGDERQTCTTLTRSCLYSSMRWSKWLAICLVLSAS